MQNEFKKRNYDNREFTGNNYDNEDFEDKELICKESGQKFIWTAGEQKFYAMKGFQEPKFCPEVRARKKRERESAR